MGKYLPILTFSQFQAKGMFSLRIASLSRAIIKMQFRPFSPVQSKLAFVQSKNLFSDSFHLVDITEKEIFKVKTETKDSLAFKDKIRSSFNNNSDKTETKYKLN